MAGMDLDEGAAGVRLRNQQPFLFEPLQVKFDGLANELKHLLPALAGRDTARQVGTNCLETGRPPLRRQRDRPDENT